MKKITWILGWVGLAIGLSVAFSSFSLWIRATAGIILIILYLVLTKKFTVKNNAPRSEPDRNAGKREEG